MATRNGNAEWRGDLSGGEGDLTVGDGVFRGAYTAKSRFEEGEGTNPEELIAAAHAACFSMAFASDLATNGHTPETVTTTARLHLRNIDGAPTIARIDLGCKAAVPGIGEDEFQRIADGAKRNCPVSRALASVPEIALQAELVA